MVRNENTYNHTYRNRRLTFLILLPVLFLMFVFAFQRISPANAADSTMIKVTDLGAYSTIPKGTVIYYNTDFVIVYNTLSGSTAVNATLDSADSLYKITVSNQFDDWHVDPDPFSGIDSYYLDGDDYYNANYNTVNFVDKNNKVLKSKSFKFDGNSNSKNSASYVETSAPLAADVPDIVENGYTYKFNGNWSPQFSDIPNSKQNSPIVYTAQYDSTINSYTVKFVDEAGKTISVVDNNGKTVESISYNYGTKAADIIKPADTPTKASDNGFDYTFKDWSPAITDVTADATYTASFNAVPKKFKITYNLDGGKNSDSNPAEYEYGAGVKSFADATKDGYTFGGWYGEAELTNKVTSIPDTADADVTLYAKFTKVEQATEATTQATTQATTEATTQATTQATTEAPKETKVEQPTEAATQATQKEAKKAQNTKSPGTGDSAPLVIAIVVMLASLAGIVCVFVRKAVLKKNK